MKYQETVGNVRRYIQELDPKQQVIHASVAVSGLLIVAGLIAGAKENYRGINDTDCYGTVRTDKFAGYSLEDAAEQIATHENVPSSDISSILIHDNPGKIIYSPYTDILVIAEDAGSIVIPERCD